VETMRAACKIVLFALLAAAGSPGEGHDGVSPACEQAKLTHGWCEAENVGYVASVEIRSHALYEALDAHGHDIDPAAVTCGTCREALKSDGFCAAHRMGYVGGEAFLSPLTYQIARGRTVDPGKLACRVCRKNSRGIGWCETHQVGIAGRVAIDNRQRFEEFRSAYAMLLAAVETSQRCETCAAAMVAEGYCSIHRLKYRDGLPAATSPP